MNGSIEVPNHAQIVADAGDHGHLMTFLSHLYVEHYVFNDSIYNNS